MQKKLLMSGLALAMMLALAACGGGGGGGSSPSVEPTGETKEFTIEATNYAFDLQEIRVNQGDTVKITLVNKEGMHAVKFDGYNQEVQAGKTIEFVANKKGEFKYICSIFCGTGHDDMVGKLIVE